MVWNHAGVPRRAARGVARAPAGAAPPWRHLERAGKLLGRRGPFALSQPQQLPPHPRPPSLPQPAHRQLLAPSHEQPRRPRAPDTE